MDPVGRECVRRYARLAGMVGLALCAAVALSGCITIQATPEVIYITPAPRTPASSSSLSPSPTSSASSSLRAGSTSCGSVAPSSSAAPSSSCSRAPEGSVTGVGSQTITKSASDGRWTLTFRRPTISGPAGDVIDAMDGAISRRVDAYISAFESSDLPTPASGDGPSTLHGDFSVALQSTTLLSIRFAVQRYVSGAANSSSTAGSLNLLVSNGAAIQFVDLFTSSGSALPVLTSQSHTLLSHQLGSGLLWPATITMADFQNAWVITTAGLELTWNQSTIGPAAAGNVTITIPWSALRTVIAPSGPAGSFVA